MYYLYILQSEKTGRFYIGQCENVIIRYHQHASGRVKSTKGRGPWEVAYWEAYDSRSGSVARERYLKSLKSSVAIQQLIIEWEQTL